ncbi:MAG: Flp pilus assembly protein CpaB [Planctomycetota bacterium]|jgi:Flp pilus assembly protein CpaB
MKWGIAIFILLGLVAAACSALLMGALRVDRAAGENTAPGIEVVMAKASLPAMTLLTGDHIIKETVSADELPEGRLSSPTRIVGRVLAIPVVEGQVLTDSCFVTDGTGAQLAAMIPPGMRAFTINLSRGAIPDQLLLYPGCVVDVLVAWRLQSRGSEAQALSHTMLREIQVVAVAGDSVISSPADEEADTAARPRRANTATTVTLLVSPNQAEALQLAVDNGSSISLSIRNPLDQKIFGGEGTVLRQGQLANYGSTLESAVLTPGQNGEEEPAPKAGDSDPNGLEAPVNAPFNTHAQQPKSTKEYRTRQRPRWGITVIRGSKTEVQELDLPEGGSGTGAKK